uniref:Uncharacterized protein n=1 Tax=Romanomermis culicivorax TaxID=13658 RepID=A0A915IIC5_ROMCU
MKKLRKDQKEFYHPKKRLTNDGETAEASEEMLVNDPDEPSAKRSGKIFSFQPLWRTKFRWLTIIDKNQRIVVCKICKE